MIKVVRKNSGQSLLIILLIMAVGLTIGLAVISHSITDIGISRQEEESARVFSVAEMGIENALVGGSFSGSSGGISYNVTYEGIGNKPEFVFPDKYEAGDIQTLWLVEHGSNDVLTEEGRFEGSSVDLYWGNENQEANQSNTPALEVTLVYKDGNKYKIKRGVFDPNASRRSQNNFDGADASGPYLIGGEKFKFRKLGFELAGIPYLLRLRFLYNDEEQVLGVAASDGSKNLPSQGTCYESTATDPQTGLTRKVRHCQLHKAPPGIFDYALYSEGDLKKD